MDLKNLNKKTLLAIGGTAFALVAVSAVMMLVGGDEKESPRRLQAMEYTPEQAAKRDEYARKLAEENDLAIAKAIEEEKALISAEQVAQKQRESLPEPELPGIDRGNITVTGFQVVIDPLTSAQIQQRKREIDQIASAWPADKRTCDQLPGYSATAEETRHKNVYQNLCERAGPDRYFSCSPTGVRWDVTIAGCETY